MSKNADYYFGESYSVLYSILEGGPMCLSEVMARVNKSFYPVKKSLFRAVDDGLLCLIKGVPEDRNYYTLTEKGYTMVRGMNRIGADTFGEACFETAGFEEWTAEIGKVPEHPRRSRMRRRRA